MSETEIDQYERQRQHDVHSQNLSRANDTDDGDNPKTLEYLADIDDLPELPDDGLDQLTSKLASTANLDDEQVRGNEWVREYLTLLWQSHFPPQNGLTGHVRAWAYDDTEEYRDPLDASTMVKLEGYLDNSKLALSRSKDFEGVETATRDTRESIVRGNENGSSGGGILGRFRS